MVEHIANRPDDSQFQDNNGSIFHSDIIGAHMLTTSTTVVTGIKKGDPVAQVRFMRIYGDPCRCYYEAKNGKWGFDRDTAKELAKNVLEKLCLEKKLHSYEHIPGVTKFHSYLFTVLDNAACDHLRRKMKKLMDRAVPIDTDSEPIGMPAYTQLPEAGIKSERACIEKLRRRILGEAIQVVKEREVQGNPDKGKSVPFDVDILIWMKCEGRTSPEIASETEISDNAVRARARAAKIRLREAIREILREDGMTEGEIDDEIADLCW
jgi:DNA-directed RNA polymerase specialized sigma24 family protein